MHSFTVAKSLELRVTDFPELIFTFNVCVHTVLFLRVRSKELRGQLFKNTTSGNVTQRVHSLITHVKFSLQPGSRKSPFFLFSFSFLFFSFFVSWLLLKKLLQIAVTYVTVYSTHVISY